MAYAAVISLIQSTNERLNNFTIIPQITRSAYDNALKRLKEILIQLDHTKHRRIDMSVINALDAEIREAVCKLEDVVESYVLLYHYHQPSHSINDEGFPQPRIPPVDEKDVKQEIDSFLKIVKKLGEAYTRELDKPIILVGDSVFPGFSGKKSSTTVGLLNQVDDIIKKLLDSQSGTKTTVSLVGMAGIGKTHLAREIYQHPIIVQHFEFIVWLSVGQKCRMKTLFVEILAHLECKPRDLYMEQEIDALVVLLQNCLHGRRYLVFLDDVWSRDVYNDLICWLPDNRGRGRFVMTTRLEEVARNTSIYNMQFLNNDESWINLLWRNVFGEKSFFPPQLRESWKEDC